MDHRWHPHRAACIRRLTTTGRFGAPFHYHPIK
jgi:hypothetical protein